MKTSDELSKMEVWSYQGTKIQISDGSSPRASSTQLESSKYNGFGSAGSAGSTGSAGSNYP